MKKLSIQVTCTICLGTRTSREAEGSSPCYYCDSTGKHYVEASDQIIIKCLQQKSKDAILNIINALTQEIDNG